MGQSDTLFLSPWATSDPIPQPLNLPLLSIKDSAAIICYAASMANDDDFILGGRKTKKSSSSQGTPRTQNPRGGSNQSGIKLGAFPNSNMSFTKRLAKDMAIAKRSSGRRTYAKPSKPKTGRFNARGRGRSALAAGIGPNRSWQTFDGSNIRYRSRRAVVKVRVMKLRGGKARAAYSRVGYGWDNTAKQDVFRIGIGSKKNPDRIKIHLHRFKERLPAKQ